MEIHKEEKVYVPELIFGHLLTSSNYDDDEKKVCMLPDIIFSSIYAKKYMFSWSAINAIWACSSLTCPKTGQIHE